MSQLGKVFKGAQDAGATATAPACPTRHGLRCQSAAATPLSSAWGRHAPFYPHHTGESGVALRFPPPSMTRPICQCSTNHDALAGLLSQYPAVSAALNPIIFGSIFCAAKIDKRIISDTLHDG